MQYGFVGWLENLFFGYRKTTLAITLGLTLIFAHFGLQLRMEAGFEKQIPIGHEYTQTYLKYKNALFGVNRITVVVAPVSGKIWTRDGLTRLYRVTQALTFLPNIDRLGVQSLWTPNSFVNEITEDGFRAEPIIPGTVTPEALTDDLIAQIRQSTVDGGYIGSMVAHDETSAMITADLNEVDAQGRPLDYIAFNDVLESKIRKPFEDAGFKIEIIGFSKQTGDIANGASGVLVFCAISLLLTALAVYWYSHSIQFTLLPIFCSLCSLVWQFGSLRLLGFGLDPLGVLVPFLIFSIGVSHGIQQINAIVRELADGATPMEAGRTAFRSLLIPGTLALITAFVSFITLALIPIPMVRELAVTATLGVGFKVVTNLVMLPVAATFAHVGSNWAAKAVAKREARSNWLRHLSKVAEPRNAVIVTMLALALFGVSVWQSRDRVIGTLQPGAPELRPEARFNQDAMNIASHYDLGLDWLSVIFEAPATDCSDPRVGLYQDKFVAAMQTVPGIASVASYSSMLRTYSQGYNEDAPRMSVIPYNPETYAALSVEIGRVHGYMTKDCAMTAVHFYLSDHKARTITGVIDAVKAFREAHPVKNITIRLAAGNAGVLAATNDEVARSELPMMLYVYAAILVLVFLAYRDFRAMIACCVPLTVATFVGYWFMKELEIGLTVATLPVMVLAVGIGVDYSFYIYNRMQYHLAHGKLIVDAVEMAIVEVGMATIFTAITLAVGVATWSLSALKFQADMGKLLAFMFIVNVVMAMTVLPALAVVLERIFPRRKAVTVSAMFDH